MTIYYLTKYATTRGIFRFEGEDALAGEYVTNANAPNYGDRGYVFARAGRDAFDDLDAAKADALRRIKRNVESKRKALAKAKALLTQPIAINDLVGADDGIDE